MRKDHKDGRTEDERDKDQEERRMRWVEDEKERS